VADLLLKELKLNRCPLVLFPQKLLANGFSSNLASELFFAAEV